jgi:hypothetical protein
MPQLRVLFLDQLGRSGLSNVLEQVCEEGFMINEVQFLVGLDAIEQLSWPFPEGMMPCFFRTVEKCFNHDVAWTLARATAPYVLHADVPGIAPALRDS